MLELLLHFHNAFHGEGIEMVLGDEDEEEEKQKENQGSNRRAGRSHGKNRKKY